MNRNVVDSIIASIIFGLLSTGVGFILQAFGFSAQTSIITALLALLALMLLFLVVRRYYPIYVRWLTERLVENTLQVNTNEADEARTAFKKKIVERVLLENTGIGLQQNSSVVEFLNQEACETHIREASRNARKIKILTIRGEKYFLGPQSVLYNLRSTKHAKSSTVGVLVLSPESQHITEDLAANLDHESAEEIKAKMRIVFNYLKLLASQNKNFEVKSYDETPNFKILLFDDVMFVSTFAGGGPKNDHNAKMLQITREGNPLFTGFEKHFDELWKRSVSPP